MVKDNITEVSFQDNYADGAAADVWDVFIGDIGDRLVSYKEPLCNILRQHGAKRVLDVACGTGPDSVMLVEEGFEVTSIDASDKMLKYALKTRWDRRKEPGFDSWEIREGNWLTLVDDVSDILGEGYDALVCIGNSFSHLLDPKGDQCDQRLAIKNFKACLKPGGILIIDHRNYDEYQEGSLTPEKSIYYHIKGKTDVKTTLITKDGRPQYLHYDYTIEPFFNHESKETSKGGNGSKKPERANFIFRLFPHYQKVFSKMLEECFDSNSEHKIYGDYKPLAENPSPGYFVHTIKRGT